METIHVVGIGGSGMLPLAELLLKKGYCVTGSDRLIADPGCLESISPPIRKRLERLTNLGASLYPQDGSGITESTARIVISTAIESTNPDRVQADALNVPVLHRAQELKRQTETGSLIAIAGTSGKSTTAALCAWMLLALDELASFVGGAEILDSTEGIGWTAVHVGDGQWSCIEVDESDKSLLNFHPNLSVILNITRDHHSYQENLAVFQTFCEQTHGPIALNRNDRGCVQLAEGISPERIHWFVPPSARDVTCTRFGMTIALHDETYEAPLMGLHNAENLAAALAVIRLAVPSASGDVLKQAVKTFPGIRRRLHRYGSGEIAVYDDYAHNPEKISALLNALKERYPRLHIVFQPHGYSPLRFHLEGFAQTFSNELREDDRLILLPVYDAGGTTDRSISSQDLADRIESRRVCVACNREDAIEDLKRTAAVGDAIVVTGARDDTLAELAESISKQVTGARPA